MFRVVLCLKDSFKRSFISSKIDDCFSQREIIYSIVSFNSSNQIIRQGIKTLNPDIFIFDPSETNGKGISTALSVKRKYPHVTLFAFGNYNVISMPDLKSLHPIFPISLYDIKEFYINLVDSYEHNLKDSNHFSFFVRPNFISHPLDEIKYFFSEGRRIHLISDEGDVSFYNKLDTVENQLTYKNCLFVRIHQSYLVNSRFISNYDRYSITLDNGINLGISNFAYYKNLKHIMQN